MSNAGTEEEVLNKTEVWKYLLENLGPQESALEVAIPFTILNLLIFVSGLLGNIAVCVVIIRHPSMHTATNYYLFNLAVSDLTLLIFGLPNDVAVYWHQYPWILGVSFCKIRALLSEMASYVSVLTIVAFSSERYLAICYPLYLYTMSGLQRALKIIGCLWLISFFSALPFSIYTQINYLRYNGTQRIIEESAMCAMLSQPENFPLSELSTILFFIVPMLIIAVQYTRMALKISRRTREQIGNHINNRRSSRRSQSHKTVIRMLAAVVVGFFVCWAPFHAQRLLYMYGGDSEHFNEINAWMFYITGILYYFSSTLNPILYNIMSNRYRIAFREIFCGGSMPSKSSLTRNSTFRETKQISHSDSQRTAEQCTPPNQTLMALCNVTESGQDKLRLFDEDLLAVRTPKNGNTIIYQIALKPKDEFTSLKHNQETCI